jgi:2'-5' RNA ligase
MHLTLFFLGETGVSQLSSVQSELNLLASRHAPFTLRLNGVGAFPNRKKPRIFWAGLGDDIASLRALQADLTARLVSLGWQAEKRPFRPHITLGRVKNHKKMVQVDWKGDLARLQFEVTAVHLMQSELRPSGAVYSIKQIVSLIQR